MAASGGSPPASWRAWRASRCRPTATASATTTACSGRASPTAGSRNCRRTGSPSATRGSSSGRRSSTRSASAARSSIIAEGGVIKRVWHPTRDACTRSPTTRRSSAGAAATSTRCACGRRAPPTRCSSRPSTAATMSARWPHRARAEAISRVLYPSDATPAGQELRLRQEYFFTSASLQDLVRRHLQQLRRPCASLPDKAAIQLNDTHPAIAVAELMRLLVDEHGLPWEEAWAITTQTLSYTNHTLLPEALETWPVPLFERLLPRHMQIIYLINWLHLEAARRAGGPLDADTVAAVSLIDETQGERGAHGASRLPRLAQGQRRLGAAHRAHAQDRVPGPARALPGPHRQQDQRHHLPPLAAPGQPGPDATSSSRRCGERRARRSRRAATDSSRSRPTPRSRSAFAAAAPSQQGARSRG